MFGQMGVACTGYVLVLTGSGLLHWFGHGLGYTGDHFDVIVGIIVGPVCDHFTINLEAI